MKARDLQLLKELQSQPLECKINMSISRIREAVQEYGETGLYVSFSGGKDSTVLLHLVRSIYPNIKAVFCDTGLEYPEIKNFVKTFENVEIIKPKMSFKQIIDIYGYPVFSKETAKNIEYGRKAISDNNKYNIQRYLYGLRFSNKQGVCKMYTFMPLTEKQLNVALNSNYKISARCCDIMKKYPFKEYEKTNNVAPIIGTMACESVMRANNWIKTGCNSFNTIRPESRPLSFWTETDILKYCYFNNIKICSVYGEIVKNGDNYYNTGVNRTGCVFCAFGVHLQSHPNKFEQLKITHPQLYNYCLDTLKMRGLLDEIGIQY